MRTALDDGKRLKPLYSGLRKVITKSTFLSAKLPLPPPDEQAGIVAFIERKAGEIERFVQLKQRTVALLREQKTALINRAVTQGLDFKVPRRASGFDWLGDIPAHWEVKALKRVVATKITDGPHETPELIDEGIPFISAEAIKDGKVDFSARRGNISVNLHNLYSKKCKPQKFDVLICKSGATTGKVAIVETNEEFCIWSPLALLRAHPKEVLPQFLFYVTQDGLFQVQVQLSWSYGTQPNIGMGVLEQLFIPVPPHSEQAAIVEYIERESQLIEATIARAEREIELVQELKTSLISAAVTGQIDVREPAAGTRHTEPLAALS